MDGRTLAPGGINTTNQPSLTSQSRQLALSRFAISTGRDFATGGLLLGRPDQPGFPGHCLLKLRTCSSGDKWALIPPETHFTKPKGQCVYLDVYSLGRKTSLFFRGWAQKLCVNVMFFYWSHEICLTWSPSLVCWTGLEYEVSFDLLRAAVMYQSWPKSVTVCEEPRSTWAEVTSPGIAQNGSCMIHIFTYWYVYISIDIKWSEVVL